MSTFYVFCFIFLLSFLNDGEWNNMKENAHMLNVVAILHHSTIQMPKMCKYYYSSVKQRETTAPCQALQRWSLCKGFAQDLCMWLLTVDSLEKRGSRIYRPIKDTQAGTKRSFCIQNTLKWYNPPEIWKTHWLKEKKKVYGIEVTGQTFIKQHYSERNFLFERSAHSASP